jgi:hypothetical protein
MPITHVGFLATQKSGADLHSTGAEHERRAAVRPSATPPAATTGTRTASTTCGKSENSPGWSARCASRDSAKNRRDRQIENPGGGGRGFRRTSKGEHSTVRELSNSTS